MSARKSKAKSNRKKKSNIFLKKYGRLLILLIIFGFLSIFGLVTKTFVSSVSPEEQRTKILATNYLEGIKTCDAEKYTKAKSDFLYGDGQLPVSVSPEDAEKIKKVCGDLQSYEYIKSSTIEMKDGSYGIAQDFRVRAKDNGKVVTLVSRIIAAGNNKDGYLLTAAPGFPTTEENYNKLK